MVNIASVSARIVLFFLFYLDYMVTHYSPTLTETGNDKDKFALETGLSYGVESDEERASGTAPLSQGQGAGVLVTKARLGLLIPIYWYQFVMILSDKLKRLELGLFFWQQQYDTTTTFTHETHIICSMCSTNQTGKEKVWQIPGR